MPQRGAGKSTPHACLEQNTTWDLVEDIEKLRKHLEIPEWQVSYFLHFLLVFLYTMTFSDEYNMNIYRCLVAPGEAP